MEHFNKIWKTEEYSTSDEEFFYESTASFDFVHIKEMCILSDNIILSMSWDTLSQKHVFQYKTATNFIESMCLS